MSQQLGVPDEEVAAGRAELLSQMVDQATPGGELSPDADGVLERGRPTLEEALGQLRTQ